MPCGVRENSLAPLVNHRIGGREIGLAMRVHAKNQVLYSRTGWVFDLSRPTPSAAIATATIALR